MPKLRPTSSPAEIIYKIMGYLWINYPDVDNINTELGKIYEKLTLMHNTNDEDLNKIYDMFSGNIMPDIFEEIKKIIESHHLNEDESIKKLLKTWIVISNSAPIYYYLYNVIVNKVENPDINSIRLITKIELPLSLVLLTLKILRYEIQLYRPLNEFTEEQNNFIKYCITEIIFSMSEKDLYIFYHKESKKALTNIMYKSIEYRMQLRCQKYEDKFRNYINIILLIILNLIILFIIIFIL